MAENEFLPIKVILHQEDFVVANEPGGSARKMFGDASSDVRGTLIDQLVGVQDAYEPLFEARPTIPAVAKVELKEKALAKSHRPDRIFADETCPIIGVGTFRELFVRVTRQGLSNLAIQVRTDLTAEGSANISTVAAVAPITPEERMGVTTGQDLDELIARVDRDGLIKVRLFDHGDARIDRLIRDDFIRYLEEINAELIREHAYAPDLSVYVVRAEGRQLREIARHPGIRRASFMPRFFGLRHQSIPVPNAPAVDLPPPARGESYPVVAVVDSGISDVCTPLAPWVEAREDYVAKVDRNPEHGTFVAGLITFAGAINSTNLVETGGPCRLLDITVMPGNGDLTEDELLSSLEEMTAKYGDSVRVWNISLGSDGPCRDDAFSDLARGLDDLQQKHGVQFVMAAGNFQDPPLRAWPPDGSLGEKDRIAPPSDSVLGITVGALAHCQTPTTRVKVDEPSPFSRRGPAPAYLVKPELVHYGGNCDVNGNYTSSGVRSLGTTGGIAEDAGTSFSTPLVSSLLANIIGGLDPEPSLNVAKALLLHAAEYPSGIDESHINYVGFGKPTSFESIVHSTQDSATMVFEDVISPGYHLELDPFPYPACLLRNERSYGHIKMTLVYDPPLDSNSGLEYCRANIDASLGVVTIDGKAGKPKFRGKVPAEPNLHGKGYEEDLVKFGFKWSPVKSYRRSFKIGVSSQHWRLRVELLHRHDSPQTPQRFALVITVAGDEGQPVYDDLVVALRTRATTDLQLRSSVRQRIRGRLES